MTGDDYGHSVTGLPDADGDGVRDFAIGAPGHASDLGRVELRSGATGVLLWSRDGVDPNGRFGHALAGLEDVDGDNRADLCVGAPYDGTGAPNGGSVFVLSGRDGSTLFVEHAWYTSQKVGHSVADVGDWDADGRGDFAYGIPYSQHGLVRVRSGATGALLLEVVGDLGDYTGWTLCALDDLSGDGVRELALGEPYDSGGGLHAGRVRIVSGADGTDYDVIGGSKGDFFGYCVANLGDLDGDGVSDLGVGSFRCDSTGQDAGRAWVYSGATRALLYSVDGDEDWAKLGYALCAIGDVDLDGQDDWAVGAPGRNRVSFRSGATGEELGYRLGAGQVDDSTGAALAGLGDLDGDRLGDMAMASPYWQGPGWQGGGRVRVLSGICPDFHLRRFCYAIEAGVSCPCDNDASERGCTNSTGYGAFLTALGSTSIAANDLQYVATGLPKDQPALLFAGTASHFPALMFGDGLRCAGGRLRRFGPPVSAHGLHTWGPIPATVGGWAAGDTRYFQVWYHDPAGPCGSGSNLSNALEVRYLP